MRKHSTIGESERMADRVRPIEGSVKIAAVSHGRGFGHAISLANENSRERSEPARKLWRKRSCARLYPANAVLTREPPCLRRLAKSVYGRWNQRHHGDALCDDQIYKLLHIEPRYQDERGTQNQGRIENYVQSVNVIERQTAQDRILSTEFGRIWAKQLVDICHQVV